MIKQEAVTWTEDGFCIIDGYKWGVTKSGKTYCAGPVKPQDPVNKPQEQNKQVADTSPDAPQAIPSGVEEVFQNYSTGKVTTPRKNKVIMKQEKRPPGRPRKPLAGGVSRITEWRRRKEGQGALL